ncbi:MAG: periplasmic alpha-galactoside-binding protein [Devosia sp.]|uniref:ABC transporter substrate-binding protein n=1 Tax=Devosia sp. TaxID=1871048 RepID=UPI00260D2B2B|nr:ABC transporter substrate-binding protein [Devosia sp.]MDB5539679.1 periplasmic alpha-galactoside-binding protein [Devosia sp.]
MLVSISDILSFRALTEYHEPDWVTLNFVASGRLPPVQERLPREPLVYTAANMPDGIGVYGDVLRHITGGRPEGWNFMAGQSQGWGGIEFGMMECLTRTAPLFQVKPDELEPLPNLAKSWEWSADGHQLTMHLIEGAKWSDGVPFTSEDVMFYWEDHVLDPLATPLLGTMPDTFGVGTTLAALDDYTVRWTFSSPFPTQYLYEMAFGNFCPGPAHILKPQHPRYNPDNTYEAYKNAFPPEYMNMPVMGPWVPVVYRPDEIVVMRRNPYFWKVDEAGNQLPYLDEVHYLLGSWDDIGVRTLAGAADFGGMDQVHTFVEALKRAAEPSAPSTLIFGPRTAAYMLLLNMSANGWGEPDARAQAVRELNRNLDFRIAVTSALDRQRIGEALVKGPFTAVYPGGLLSGTPYYDAASTSYYPPSAEMVASHFAKADLEDRDGDGFVNWPPGTLDGGNVQIVFLAPNDSMLEVAIVEAATEQLNAAGLQVIIDFRGGNQRLALEQAGSFDWTLNRADTEFIAVVQGTPQLAPIGPRVHRAHRVGTDGTLDLLPFEAELVEIVQAFIGTSDPASRVELMRRYQRVYTENLYAIGLTQFAAPVVVNKRVANVPVGLPQLMFNFDVDAAMRERLYVPIDKQSDYELYPKTLPGSPGSDGPID